jgi:hypothetical protein
LSIFTIYINYNNLFADAIGMAGYCQNQIHHQKR